MGVAPLISVVVPLYNGAGYIRRSIQSVLRQTYSDFELIVVDDGSTDNGPEVVRTFTDARVRLIRQENAGVSAARNRGIAEAQGRYVAFLDADDEWEPQFLEAIVHLSVAYPAAGIWATGYRRVFPTGPSVEFTVAESRSHTTLQIEDYFRRLPGGSLVHASAVAIPVSVLQKLGGFREGCHSGEDEEMWGRIALHYPVGYDTRILSRFHQTGRQQKPRFRSSPTQDPLLTTLQAALRAPSEDVPRDPEEIRRLIRYRVRLRLWKFSLARNRRQVVEFLETGGAESISPLLTRACGALWLWPALCLWAQGVRLVRSRPFLRLRGGRRIRCGVLQRLGTPA
jgi:glycosyltransferase involved in cell wall biosynthesis